jgi:hypothetical protein
VEVLLSWAHRIWLGGIFAAGIVALLFLPPFQIGGEAAHFTRLYSLRGCGPVPLRVLQLPDALGERAVRGGIHFRLAHFDSAFQLTTESSAAPSGELARACGQLPTGYVLPSLSARLVERFWPTAKGRTLMAYYGARLANWLTLSAAVWLLVTCWPRFRAMSLFVYSAVIFRAVAVSQDATLLALGCIALSAQSLQLRWQRILGTLVPLLLLATWLWPPLPALSTLGRGQLATPWLVWSAAALLAIASDLAERARARNASALGAFALLVWAWGSALHQLRAIYFERLSG